MVEWSKTHNSSIEYSKLALMDFAHHGAKKERPPLILPDVTIAPSQSVKYLGIILDQNLNWAPQLAYICGKGTSWMSQIKRLTSPSWRLTPKGTKKLYTSVALPRILYGIDIWCTPIHRKNAKGSKKGSVNIVKKLTTIQRAGALVITGGLRTTLTDTLNTHTLLLPMELRVEKACYNAITHISSLPTAHPLHAPAKRSTTGKRYVKQHHTSLHTLLGMFTIDPSKTEKVSVV
jgi:hypothetical protein